jgi:hypothetical protein
VANTPTRTAERAERKAREEEQVAAAPEITRPTLTEDDIRAMVEARVQAAVDEAMTSPPTAEIAEPLYWWDLYAIGPIQLTAFGGPLLPHQVIKVGEQAFVVTVLYLNPWLYLTPGTSACDVLSNFALPYEVRYQTGNLTTWTLGQPDMNVVHSGGLTLVPGQCWYVDVLAFNGSTEGLYEMNVSARILAATAPFKDAPQFAGYATMVTDIDAKLFGPGPVTNFGMPVRFQVYP